MNVWDVLTTFSTMIANYRAIKLNILYCIKNKKKINAM